MDEWLSLEEAADMLELSRSSVYRSLTADEETRQKEWGAEGEGWRLKPLVTRRIYQVRRSWVMKKAGLI